jgi:S-adenosylmethionine-diacylgycerolhomoserine-N-methlytransferase
MLLTARQIVEREGLTSRIRLANADATRFDPAILFGVPSFSRIFISYSLSMIPAWESVLTQALAWVRPGGELHIVDFGGQERLPSWFRLGLRRWLALFHVSPRDGLEASLAGLAESRAAAVSRFERPYRGYAQYAVCQRGNPCI